MAERTEQIVREAPEIEAYKLGLLESAKALGDFNVNLPVQQIAGMTDLQRAAMQQAGMGIGDYIPYLTEGGRSLGGAGRFMASAFGPDSPYGSGRLSALAALQQAQNVSGETAGFTGPQQQALNFLSSSFGATSPYGMGRRAAEDQIKKAAGALPTSQYRFDPSARTPDFFDPYQQEVVDRALGDVARQGDIARQRQRAEAVSRGAFGGSRGELAEQELNRNILEQQARLTGELRSQGYQQSLAQAQQAFEAQQLRAQFGRSLGDIAGQAGQLGIAGSQAFGQLGAQGGQYGLDRARTLAAIGEGIGGIAGQAGQLGIAGTEALGTLGLRQAALGELGQQMGQRESQFLFDIGKLGQAQQQAELEALRQSQLAQLYEPYQRVSFLSDIYKGAPSSQMAITGGTFPGTSPAQQLLGLGIAGLSAYGGAQRAGLFG